MKYRVFIASTFKDFRHHRARIAEQLRKADIEVVGMEVWTADPDHPAQLSAKNIAGCHFCVALIGFHLGTISTTDKRGRSITQIEIDTAEAAGVRILPFVLRDSPENHEQYSPELNRASDEAVMLWRRRFEVERTSEFFNLADTPDVLPAITRQMVKWEQARRGRLRMTLIGLLVLMSFCCLLFAASSRVRTRLVSRIAAYHDSVVFQHSRDGEYSTVRLLNGRSDIRDNTNLREELLGATKSFSLFANTFGSFREYQADFENAAKRGVQLRFVVTDFSPANRGNWEPFLTAVEDTPKNVEESLAVAANTRAMIHSLQVKYPNLVSYRLNSRPILYTAWVRDAGRTSGLAHLGIHYYGTTSQSNWPALRFSQTTGSQQFRALSDQFENIWNSAHEDPEFSK